MKITLVDVLDNEMIYAERLKKNRWSILSLLMMWYTHIEGRPHTHTLHALPWMGRVWASNRVKSVSLSSTWLQHILYALCVSLFKE